MNVELGLARRRSPERGPASRRADRRPSAATRRAEPARDGESAGDTPRAARKSARRAAPASSGPRAPGSRPSVRHCAPPASENGVLSRPGAGDAERHRHSVESAEPPQSRPAVRGGATALAPPEPACYRSPSAVDRHRLRLLDPKLHAAELNDVTGDQPPRLPREEPLLIDERATRTIQVADRELLARGQRAPHAAPPSCAANSLPGPPGRAHASPFKGIAHDRLAVIERVLMPDHAAANDLERPATNCWVLGDVVLDWETLMMLSTSDFLCGLHVSFHDRESDSLAARYYPRSPGPGPGVRRLAGINVPGRVGSAHRCRPTLGGRSPPYVGRLPRSGRPSASRHAEIFAARARRLRAPAFPDREFLTRTLPLVSLRQALATKLASFRRNSPRVRNGTRHFRFASAANKCAVRPQKLAPSPAGRGPGWVPAKSAKSAVARRDGRRGRKGPRFCAPLPLAPPPVSSRCHQMVCVGAQNTNSPAVCAHSFRICAPARPFASIRPHVTSDPISGPCGSVR